MWRRMAWCRPSASLVHIRDMRTNRSRARRTAVIVIAIIIGVIIAIINFVIIIVSIFIDVLVTIITPPAQPYVPRALEPPALTIMMAVWAACVLEI